MFTFYYFITHSVSQFFSLFIWWYGHGLWLVLKQLGAHEYIDLKNIGLISWVKHFFVPMFHDYTIIGRGLSIVVRFFIILGKLIRLVLGIILRIVFLCVWIGLPLFLVWGVVNYIAN